MGQIINQILGFAVLTSPLFLIVLWVPVCIALALWVGTKFIKKSLPTKIAGAAAVFLIALPLPIADEIAGRIYFNHLCDTDAGVKVFQTIELPAEYWDKDGKPRFYDESNGNFRLPLEKYALVEAEKTKLPFGIEKNCSLLRDKISHEVISIDTLYRYWGGWISRNFTPHNTAIHCGGESKEFVTKQFKPTR